MIDKILFDNYGGKSCYLYVLKGDGIEVGITDLGAAVQYIRLRTANGVKNVALGYPTIRERLESGSYCGATIGRVANRISGAKFRLNGIEYILSANDGANTNHGGEDGFDKRYFKGDIHGDMLELTLESADGDMGFPGRLLFKVQFGLKGRTLTVRYAAESDEDTLWSPTSHIYFNMDGAGSACGNLIKINAQSYTPLMRGLIPTGEVATVTGTPFDFTEFKPICRDLGADDEQLKLGNGYDHNFILNGEYAASAAGAASGIKVHIYTDMPCLQFYSGNFLSGVYSPRDGFALEPQSMPDAVNNPQFTAHILKGGEPKTYYIRYEFDF